MPMYDYRCKECGHVFELLVMSHTKRLDATTEPCPKCGKTDCIEWGYFSHKAPAGYVDMLAINDVPGQYKERRQEMAKRHGRIGRW